jgi:anti-sigma B factor antagonist
MKAREHVDESGVHIVELSGEVDLHHSVELRDILGRHAEEKRPRLIVDFSGVSYIDSSGLATFIEYLQRALGYGGRVAIGGVGERLRTIFDIARLDQIFSIHPTLSGAKAALGK